MINSTENNQLPTSTANELKPSWGAVYSMAMGVSGLVVAELLPVSLLTPIASSFHITEGMAGQTVSATAIVGIFSSLFSALITRRIDRRIVVLVFSSLLALSNIIVAIAPNYLLLLTGRLLLGIALGGFWAMAAAIAMRLVPPANIPKAFSIIFGAVSVATAIAAPLGSYLGGHIGWRGTFMFASAIGLIAFIWQFICMPKVLPTGTIRLRTFVEVIKRPGIFLGIISVLLIFAGHFSFFTYLRPFLENKVGLGVSGISAILLAFGVAGFFGTTLIAGFLKNHLYFILGFAPLLMAILGIVLIAMGSGVVTAGIGIALWGVFFGTAPVAWSTWMSTSVPDEAESAGALLVAGMQLAVTLGALIGGLLFDRTGVYGSFSGAVVMMFAAAILVFASSPYAKRKKDLKPL
ncbi:MFS transporter [Pedobacter sp. BMA]|uniref:MFS transporter n=1 Tax=Pedobacter sp. BMA TaxID=1663685 RepID=UPI00064AF779|nr:MFS transporter [Pedobacter sp. BMA]KLT67045.1 major facilitator transporter [Pedobacter sp. BMA]